MSCEYLECHPPCQYEFMTISSTSRPTLEARRGESPDPPSADPQLRVGEVSLVAFYVDGRSVGRSSSIRLVGEGGKAALAR